MVYQKVMSKHEQKQTPDFHKRIGYCTFIHFAVCDKNQNILLVFITAKWCMRYTCSQQKIQNTKSHL